jgi:DNA-3-methyladenine glycosylase
MVLRLKKGFFKKEAKIVAEGLLGKFLVRKINGKELKARIVETEAYYGPKDPASRARQNGDLKKTMEMKPGTILVYGVHNNWLINFVNNDEGKAEAVLIRALEPINFNENCSGPGLLTKALKIDKSFHKKNICDCSEIYLMENGDKAKGINKIIKSNRIGVKKDLDTPLRFYIKDNKYISRK